MRGFEKVLLVIFSIIVVILSVGVLFVSTGVVDISGVVLSIKNWLVLNKTFGVVIGAISAILGLIGIFSSSDNVGEKKGGLAIKSEKGTVFINRETFENIILGITRKYVEMKNVKVDVQLTEEGVVANVFTSILPDTVVPNLTTKVQENIKSSVNKQTTVDLKDVNIKIRGVYTEPQKK